MTLSSLPYCFTFNREMSLGTRRIVENIYYDESTFCVRFVVYPDDGTHTEHVNIITFAENGKRSLEFFARNSETLER